MVLIYNRRENDLLFAWFNIICSQIGSNIFVCLSFCLSLMNWYSFLYLRPVLKYMQISNWKRWLCSSSSSFFILFSIKTRKNENRFHFRWRSYDPFWRKSKIIYSFAMNNFIPVGQSVWNFIAIQKTEAEGTQNAKKIGVIVEQILKKCG